MSTPVLSMPRCATCRYWDETGDGVYVPNVGLGICRKVTPDWEDRPPYPPAFIDAARLGGYSAGHHLATTSTFGCTEWAARRET